MLNSKKKDLLIVHLGSLGDFVITLPAIMMLRDMHRKVDIMCQDHHGKLAVALGLVDAWFPADRACFASLYSDKVHPEMKDILLSHRKILLFSFSDQLRQSIEDVTGGAVYHIPPRPEAHKRIHVSQHLMDRLEECGMVKEHDRNLANFQSPLNATKKIGRQRKILIHPGSGSKRKRWPIHNFFRLEDMLRARGLSSEFLIGPAEHDIEGIIRNQYGHRIRIHETDDLLGLLSLLKSVHGYIGNDSGVTHLSAFIGIPTLAIFGPSDPVRWRPSGRKVEIVRPALECTPCFETEQENCDTPDCLYKTSSEIVLDAFLGLFRQ